MREILFRGKRADNGEWVEGFLTIDPTICDYVIDIVGLTSIMIHPETVGQYTGLCDKNGKKIFEGDILERKAIFEGSKKKFTQRGYVKYREQWAEFVAINEDGKGLEFAISKVSVDSKNSKVEIIGNIHDNPELLKEGAE